MNGPSLVIHGHFYQPPRENPWTEEVDRERSAAPFRNWNARIAAECYRPNAVARVVDDFGNVVAIVDNYSLISFNMGPTLMSWLQRHENDCYERIIQADKEGGGAIAQAFSHAILPLATDDDIRLQLRWGMSDFENRFGRRARGIWLPECAVDDRVLAIMAEEEIEFTILAPGQAAQIRSREGTHDWVDVHHSWFDTTRPYRWVHPENPEKGVNIVFYNGPLSHAVAFEMRNLSSQALVDRMFAAAGGRDGLVTLATDGETFGHHHRYGERLLAYALDVEAAMRGLNHTNLNRAVDEVLPTHEVRVHTSAWSCAHGVGRWKEDCGCSTGGGPGWNQRWRSPLRSALNQLRSTITEIYNRRSSEVFHDPDSALDAYVHVFTGFVARNEFVKSHVRDDASVVTALTLLEMQRYAQAMFTSCGWFFNDLAGIETVQILRYAARAIDYIEELGEPSPLEPFLAVLGEARSNNPQSGTGADVWHSQVEPARVDAARSLEQVVLIQVLKEQDSSEWGAFEIDVYDRLREQRGPHVLASGVATLTHKRTERKWTYAYAALGLGGLETVGVLAVAENEKDCSSIQHIRELFANNAPVATLVRELASIALYEFDLSAAISSARENLLESTAQALADSYLEAYEQLYESRRAMIEDLARHGYELPPALRAPAELALAGRFREAVIGAELATNVEAYEDAVRIARQARAAGFEVDSSTTTALLQRLVDDSVLRAVEKRTSSSVRAALDVLALKDELHAPVDIDHLQEAIYRAVRSSTPDGKLMPLAVALRVRP